MAINDKCKPVCECGGCGACSKRNPNRRRRAMGELTAEELFEEGFNCTRTAKNVYDHGGQNICQQCYEQIFDGYITSAVALDKGSQNKNN